MHLIKMISFKNILTSLSLVLLTVNVTAQNTDGFFVKELIFPENATPAQKVEMASRLIPSPTQKQWQDLELTAFLHFGMNTFTNREWGDGKESPELFNPTRLDTDQWVKTLKDAGFKMVILTAKHHDGFCLWPTATTDHSVVSSPWQDGKGDVVKMLRESCDKYGMKMGLYLSPWDRNAKCYGDSPKYNDMFAAQLTELLSNYGTIDEVWFDGACGEGPNGKKQVYDWQRFRSIMENLQPSAVLAIMGDDVRWVGNERGQGRETEWSATAIVPGIYPHADELNEANGLFAKSPDLGSREIVARVPRLFWWPSEVDVSIRPGWFYHENEQPKSLRDLAEIYLTSVGRNSVLLLNIPPDTDGRIHTSDVARLRQFRQWINNTFNNNLISDSDGTISGNGSVINCVVTSEDITKGQRVEDFEVEVLTSSGWQSVAKGTTIGNKRILTFDPIRASKVRLKVNSYRGDRHYASLNSAHLLTMPGEEAAVAGNYEAIPSDNWLFMPLSDAWQNPEAAFDGNPATAAVTLPNRELSAFVIDLGEVTPVAGFSYLPGQADNEGKIFNYCFFTYDENTHKWIQQPLDREFSNIEHNPVAQARYFAEPVTTRRVMIMPLSESGHRNNSSIAELKILRKL